MSERPLNLVLITRRYPPQIGGAEKVLCYLAQALAEAGARVIVVCSRDPLGGDDELAQPHSDQSSPRPQIVRLPTSSLRFVGTWIYMRNLRRWLSAHEIDLAYVSMLKHDAYVTIGSGARRGFPVVVRPEGAGATGDIAWQGWGRFGRRIGLRCRGASAFVSIAPRIEAELEQAWRSGTMRPSRLEEYRNPTPSTPRIVSLPNGVPLPEIPWQPRSDWRRAPRAVFVGRLAAEKGLDRLISAWSEVRTEYPGAQLLLLGEGPMRAQLESQARAAGLAVGAGQAIEMPGAVANVETILRASDLFVLPSSEEAMSIALLEAMALAMPLVATDIPGNRRLVEHGVHGRLCALNPQALAAAIREQWTDFAHAVEMGRAARRHVDAHYSIRAVARQHLELFRTLIAERKRTIS